MNCPTCKNVNLLMMERQGIEIDYCPTCRGVWLDRGELDKIIERSRSEGPPAAERRPLETPRYNDRHDKHHDERQGHDHHHRKKSFLSDLFD